MISEDSWGMSEHAEEASLGFKDFFFFRCNYGTGADVSFFSSSGGKQKQGLSGSFHLRETRTIWMSYPV